MSNDSQSVLRFEIVVKSNVTRTCVELIKWCANHDVEIRDPVEPNIQTTQEVAA